MPTTSQEAKELVSVILEHLPAQDAAIVVQKLTDRVGQKTTDDSLKQTISMISVELDRRRELPMPTRIRATLYFVVAFHFVWIALSLVCGLIALGGALYLWPIPQWSVGIPIVTFTAWQVSSRVFDCPITRIEDAIRRRYRRPLVRAFIRHYVIRPIGERFRNGKS